MKRSVCKGRQKTMDFANGQAVGAEEGGLKRLGLGDEGLGLGAEENGLRAEG